MTDFNDLFEGYALGRKHERDAIRAQIEKCKDLQRKSFKQQDLIQVHTLWFGIYTLAKIVKQSISTENKHRQDYGFPVLTETTPVVTMLKDGELVEYELDS